MPVTSAFLTYQFAGIECTVQLEPDEKRSLYQALYDQAREMSSVDIEERNTSIDRYQVKITSTLQADKGPRGAEAVLFTAVFTSPKKNMLHQFMVTFWMTKEQLRK